MAPMSAVSQPLTLAFSLKLFLPAASTRPRTWERIGWFKSRGSPPPWPFPGKRKHRGLGSLDFLSHKHYGDVSENELEPLAAVLVPT